MGGNQIDAIKHYGHTRYWERVLCILLFDWIEYRSLVDGCFEIKYPELLKELSPLLNVILGSRERKRNMLGKHVRNDDAQGFHFFFKYSLPHMTCRGRTETTVCPNLHLSNVSGIQE